VKPRACVKRFNPAWSFLSYDIRFFSSASEFGISPVSTGEGGSMCSPWKNQRFSKRGNVLLFFLIQTGGTSLAYSPFHCQITDYGCESLIRPCLVPRSTNFETKWDKFASDAKNISNEWTCIKGSRNWNLDKTCSVLSRSEVKVNKMRVVERQESLIWK
jgi:hypothetical protein